MSKTNQKHKAGRKSSSLSIAHVDAPRRRGPLRPVSTQSECSVVDGPDRKRNRNRQSKRKCNQTQPAKPFNEFIAYIIAACAMTCSFYVTGLLDQNHKQTTPVAMPIAVPLSAQIAASGEWQMEAVVEQDYSYGVAFIKHDNAVICGEGKDPPGSYTLQGKLWSNRVWFIKRYDEEARVNGAPNQDIVFDGLVSTNPDGSLTMSGKFETQVKSGFPTSYYKKTQWQTVCGKWSARRIGALAIERSMRIESRQDSWNPLRNLDAQPTSQTQCPTTLQEAEHKQQEMVAICFYYFLAFAVLAIFGWIIYAAYRFLLRLSESSDANRSTRE